MLSIAVLCYGTRRYDVKPNDTLPLPEEFDFENPEACAKKIFAIMSNASGGFTLRDCRFSINVERKTANLTSSGCHVYYSQPNLPKLTAEEALKFEKSRVVIELGSVLTNPYGDGWKRAVWTNYS